jgi:hypothetical protein
MLQLHYTFRGDPEGVQSQKLPTVKCSVTSVVDELFMGFDKGDMLWNMQMIFQSL